MQPGGNRPHAWGQASKPALFEGQPGLGLDDGELIAHSDVVVELLTLVLCERPLLGLLVQLVDALMVLFWKSQAKPGPSGIGGQVSMIWFDEPAPYCSRGIVPVSRDTCVHGLGPSYLLRSCVYEYESGTHLQATIRLHRRFCSCSKASAHLASSPPSGGSGSSR